MFNVKLYLIEILLFVKEKNKCSEIFAHNASPDMKTRPPDPWRTAISLRYYDAWIYEVNSLNYQ